MKKAVNPIPTAVSVAFKSQSLLTALDGSEWVAPYQSNYHNLWGGLNMQRTSWNQRETRLPYLSCAGRFGEIFMFAVERLLKFKTLLSYAWIERREAPLSFPKVDIFLAWAHSPKSFALNTKFPCPSLRTFLPYLIKATAFSSQGINKHYVK